MSESTERALPTNNKGTDMNELNQTEIEMIRALRARGFAVAVFTPEELDRAWVEEVEDAMISAGWRTIEDAR
jgi:hypothetical protein